jgi:hypothetical protein
MYRSGLVDTLVTHANSNGVSPNFLVWSPPWLFASSIKNKQNTNYIDKILAFFWLPNYPLSLTFSSLSTIFLYHLHPFSCKCSLEHLGARHNWKCFYSLFIVFFTFILCNFSVDATILKNCLQTPNANAWTIKIGEVSGPRGVLYQKSESTTWCCLAGKTDLIFGGSPSVSNLKIKI